VIVDADEDEVFFQHAFQLTRIDMRADMGVRYVPSAVGRGPLDDTKGRFGCSGGCVWSESGSPTVR